MAKSKKLPPGCDAKLQGKNAARRGDKRKAPDWSTWKNNPASKSEWLAGWDEETRILNDG